MQTTLRNFARSPDAAGLGMAISYFPPPLTSGQKCLTCNYCQDSLGTDTCDSCNGSEGGYAPPDRTRPSLPQPQSHADPTQRRGPDPRNGSSEPLTRTRQSVPKG